MSEKINIKIWAAISVLLVVMGSTAAARRTIHVPGQFTNIQAAIDDANDGDIILVSSGTYRGQGNRDIDFAGRAIIVRSEHGPANCIIDCQGSPTDQHQAFYFHNDENADSILDGFTITNAYHDYGAIFCDSWDGSNPTITNCIISNNHGSYAGAIKTHWYSTPTISNCIISGNSSDHEGAGLNCSGAIVSNCLIFDNRAGEGGGAGIMNHSHYGTMTITNCTIAGNEADSGTAGIWIHNRISTATITNCIVWGNRSNWPSAPQIQVSTSPAPFITYCDVQGGWPGQGNIDADPCFADANNGDFHLLPSSPCMDTGDNTVVTVTTDLDDNPRIINGIVDMGTYEYQGPHIFYVDSDANGLNDGTSWANAYNYLQDALADANSSAKPVEILVAQGVYTPDSNSAEPNGSGDRTATFQLINGVAIKGGYAGYGEPNPNARDIELYETTLSGDLDETLPELNEDNFEEILSERGPRDYNNCYHVVTGSGTDETAVLDGFVITGGTANGPGFGEPAEAKYFRGGGVYIESGSPVLVDCKIIGNLAFVYGGPASRGGGVYNLGGSPRFVRCEISMNWAYDYDSNSYGAGMANDNSSPTLIDCVFKNNLVLDWGGGMSNSGAGSATIISCIFVDNRATHGGGAIWYSTDVEQVLRVSGSLFVDNITSHGGVAIGGGGGRCEFRNCTFVGNEARDYGGGNAIDHSRLKAVNCIFRNGANEVRCSNCPEVQITYSNVQGGWQGEGNMDADPCFADPGNSDYHLKSQASRWESSTQSWVQDEVTSPCIDAGDMSSPIGYEPFPNGGIINMGAYGGTSEASKSYFGEPICETIVAGDINGDCIINFLDFSLMAYHWLEDNNP